jgi:hypothetical protein
MNKHLEFPNETLREISDNYCFHIAALKNGKRYRYDASVDELISEAINELLILLQQGAANEEVQKQLAENIKCFINTTAKQNSQNARSRSILGLPQPPSNRPKGSKSYKAAAAYSNAVEAGASEDQAREFAYRVYFPGYDPEERKIKPVGRGDPTSSITNAYKKDLEELVKVLNKELGSLAGNGNRTDVLNERIKNVQNELKHHYAEKESLAREKDDH